MKTLHDVIEQVGEVFIIADAIDECPEGPERDQVLTSIDKINGWVFSNRHFLVTSRKCSDIEEKLSASANTISITEIVDSDILLYIQNQLQGRRKLSRWPQDAKDKIEERLAEGANGM